MPSPTPGSLVPAVLTAEPWTVDEMVQMASSMGAPTAAPGSRSAAADERTRFVGEAGEVEFFRASRSLRWRARGAASTPRVATPQPQSAVGALGEATSALLHAELGLDRGGARLRAREPARPREASPWPAGPPGARRMQALRAAEHTTFALERDDIPLVGAQLVTSVSVTEQQLRALGLNWNRPAQPDLLVRTLPLDALDAALRPRGAGRARWARTPTIVYKLAYPHLRQGRYVPLYELALRDARGGRDIATVYCTAFLTREYERLLPDATAPYLGDVLAL